MYESKITKVSTVIGCALLIIMALFHGSGINYLNNIIQQSDSESFVKEIFPVLFAYPSIQLLGLASLGILTFFMRYEIKKILFFITIMVCINSILAFYLRAIIPGALLIISCFSFGLGGIKCTK